MASSSAMVSGTVATSLSATRNKDLLTSASSRFLSPFPRTLTSHQSFLKMPTIHCLQRRSISAEFSTEPQTSTTITPPFHRLSLNEPRKVGDVLVESLELEGVTDVFSYDGGDSMEIHHALTRSPSIINHLFRTEQGEIFAAEGYARSTGRPGVCIATSGLSATNLVSGLADAHLDSVPFVAITVQLPCHMIGTEAFQETSIVQVTRSISKHSYLVLEVEDIPRVIKEAFFLARSGRPGPVIVDIPKDIQQQLVVPCPDPQLPLQAYLARLPKPPQKNFIEQVLRVVSGSRRPVLYVGGGCSKAAPELRRFVELTGIPVASTLMGLGVYPTNGDLSLKMLGMHGTVYANYAVDKCDLLLAFGVRFDDRVTGKRETFASRAKIVHIDIDPAEIGKNKQPHLSICADMKQSLEALNSLIQETMLDKKLDFSLWREELDQLKKAHPLSYKEFAEAIAPQYAIQMLDELTHGEAIISTGVGQHQMWAAQYYTFKRPLQWLTSAGLGAMGFGLPAAAGAAVGNPGVTVIDIDGDGSFHMNIQELATIRIENLPVKVMVLNNQHLGMVVQWEDRFYKGNRAHTYLGDPSNEAEIYPDFVANAKGFNIPSARVAEKGQVREAIRKMLETPGPYLLDVIVPHQEHVLPMIPSGGAFKDIITEGDGRTLY